MPILALAVTIAPAMLGGQTSPPPLSYRGWELGISLDSARQLTSAQLGSELACVGAEDKTFFCQSGWGTGYASLYFSPTPRRLDEVYVLFPLDTRASRDSIANAFMARWGPSMDRNPVPPEENSIVAMDIIGHWGRAGMIAGLVAIATVDTTKSLGLLLFSPARTIRLARERAADNRKR